MTGRFFRGRLARWAAEVLGHAGSTGVAAAVEMRGVDALAGQAIANKKSGLKAARWAPLLAALSILASPLAVQATNIGPWVVDSNYQVTFSAWALTGTTHTSFHDSYTNNVNPTDITPSHFHDVTVEVTAYDAFYGGTGWVGAAVCLGYADYKCESVQVKINLSYGPYSQLESDSIMCEEIGHALGLDHDWMPTSATCMSQNPSVRRWNSHDVGLINGWF